MSQRQSLLSLIAAIARSSDRAQPLNELAQRLGAEHALVFIRDREVGSYLLAPGLPPTLPRGAPWRAFLSECVARGEARARLPYPDALTETDVIGIAVAYEGVIALLGPGAGAAALQPLLPALEMWIVALQAEQRALFAEARLATATAGMARSEHLLSELDRTRHELERLNLELREAIAMREHFLTNAAHELKTPLTTIKGLTALARRRMGRGLALEDFPRFEDLESQIARLEALVSDLLDVSRIHHGRLQLQRQRMDLVAFVGSVLERERSLPGRFGEHRVAFERDGPVMGEWDQGRLDEVFTNIINNAFKYSPAGGEIRVEVRERDGWAEVEVSDQGVGISEHDQRRLFQPFQRASTELAIEGTGLGLYIAARVVEAHGGAISLSSTVGHGSSFCVRLPLSPAVAERSTARTRD